MSRLKACCAPSPNWVFPTITPASSNCRQDAPVGTDIREYLKLDDNTIEISVTPNRADCLGIIGVARDVAVLNQSAELNAPEIAPVEATISDVLPIQVDAPEACPRYLGRVVKGINVKAPTPLWMKEKLRRCGIRSIDAVVDVTNYVLLELGQPMHAFDKDRIEGGIVVRMAKEGETLVLLDGSEAKLERRHPGDCRSQQSAGDGRDLRRRALWR